MRILIAMGVLGVFLAAGGCATDSHPRDTVSTIARFFLENSDGNGTPLALPKSGTKIVVNSKPVLTEVDIVNVELVQVELGKCLLFQLTPSATRDFYRLSVTHNGRRIVLVLNGTAVGARRLDGAITDGAIFVFAELPDEELPRLVEDLKRSSAALQRAARRK